MNDNVANAIRPQEMAELEFRLVELFGGIGCCGALALRLTSGPLLVDSDQTSFEAEDTLSATSAPGRLQEFKTGRALARQCMAKIGAAPQAIGRGTMREPLWPSGLTGSISHAKGLLGAVVWQHGMAAGIGLDIERADRVMQNHYEAVFTDTEIQVLAGIDASFRDTAAAQLFSAKEAIYKAQYPLTRSYIGFHDISLAFDAASKSIRFQHVPDTLKPLKIKVFVHSDGDHVIAGAVAKVCQPSPK